MKAEASADYSNLELQLLSSIRESFNFHLVSNATFLAEKLLAERDTEETRLVLAECYFAEAKHNMVYQLLKGSQSPQGRYLFALAAIKLGRNDHAEAALLKDLRDQPDPQGLAAMAGYNLFLLGEAYERSGKEAEAVAKYKKAFEVNPHLWVAYEKVCKLGESKDSNLAKNPHFFSEASKKTGKELLAPLSLFQQAADREKAKRLAKPEPQAELLAESLKLNPKLLPAKKSPTLAGLAREKPAVLAQNSSGSNSPTGKELLGLLRAFALPYHDMVKFNSKTAIEGFKALPKKQQATAWTHVNIGRCFMDIGDNERAEEAFLEAFGREPYRIKGVEYYSSCLWQLKKQKELCELAFTVIEFNQFAPEAWIALGNCYSLQRDHDSALNFFNRAIQLDPRFGYAHCLKGHEYIYCDQLVKAKNCYEMALKIDQNHFHAWWGLGNVSLKQEKYDRALEYFNKANKLNSKNSIIYSYIGIVYDKMDKNQEALAAFKKSEELNPKALMTRFHKTQIYYKLGDYGNALKELESLINLSPKESQLYIMIGNVHKRLGNTNRALEYYLSAQDLENKESQRVKNLIDALTNKNNQFNSYENDFN